MIDIQYAPLMADLEKMLAINIGSPEGNIITFPEAIEGEWKKKPVRGIQIPMWKNFNKATDGLRPNEFSILCGPTGAGKTTVLANLYAAFVSQGIPIFGAPVEVGYGSFARKVVSIIAGVHPNAVHGDQSRIREKFGPNFLSNEGMILSRYGNRVNHKHLLCDLLYAHNTRGTKIALIDNLNFMMRPMKSEDMLMQYDQVIHDFITFLKHIPMHVIMVMHPRKTDSMRVEHEGDIKGSSTAIQEAQNVLLFNRLENSNRAPQGTDPFWCREIKIAKCRENGRYWGQKILFTLNKVSEHYEEREFM